MHGISELFGGYMGTKNSAKPWDKTCGLALFYYQVSSEKVWETFSSGCHAFREKIKEILLSGLVVQL
jgi:hypothetical protein